MLDVELDLKAKDGQRRKATKMNAATAPYFVDFLGKRIMVYPHVFYPEIDTELLAKSARVNPSDRVFEPFAGTGAIAIFLSNQSAAVVATDVNPDAVKNISENIRLHGLEKKARIELANIFPSSNEKFDVIVANPPYTDHEAKNIEEKSMWDKNHETIKNFFRDAKKYLTAKGKIYCSWSNFADFEFLEKLAKESGYSIKSVNEVAKVWQIYRVYEIEPL